jgi:type I restriction enzyme R subunit
MPLPNLVSHLKQSTPQQVKEWWEQRKAIAQILDRRDGGTKPMLVSRHGDELIGIERGYGNAERPEDYLDSFRAFLLKNMNKIPALMVVTQRPRELTRAQLKELKMRLDTAGYTETNLKTAWRETTNEDIAASIIGFIRQATLGDALISYTERVDRAMKKILASQSWTPPQRKWLERIGKTQGGGFDRLNKVFNGDLENIVIKIHESIWDVA